MEHGYFEAAIEQRARAHPFRISNDNEWFFVIATRTRLLRVLSAPSSSLLFALVGASLLSSPSLPASKTASPPLNSTASADDSGNAARPNFDASPTTSPHPGRAPESRLRLTSQLLARR